MRVLNISSRAAKGSSSKSTDGSVTMALASEHRIRMPPESCLGNFPQSPLANPTASSASAMRLACVALGHLATEISSGSRTFSSTVRQGKSVGSWNTYPRSPVRRVGCSSPKLTKPESAGINLAIVFKRVLLPQPDGPNMATICPAGTLKSRSLRIARSLPKRTQRLETSILAGVVTLVLHQL